MKKINVKLNKRGSENDAITNMISSMNSGVVEFSARDLEGWLWCQKARFPSVSDYMLVKDAEEPETYHVSEDGGKTFTLSIEWVDIFELKVEKETEDDLKEIFN